MNRSPGDTGGTDLTMTTGMATGAVSTGFAPLPVRPARPPSTYRPMAGSGGMGSDVTAEIPLVRPSGGERRPVVLGDGTLWYPGHSRRLPAPFAVRLGVWLLFFVLLIGLGGLEVVRVHPTWLSFLRSTGNPSATATAGGTAPGGTAGGASLARTATPGGFRLVSESSAGSTYSVPATSYSIVLTLTHPCWTQVASPAGSSSYLVQQTLTAADSPRVIAVVGSSTVRLAAQATSITIRSGNKTLGVINTPQVFSRYNFVPTGH